MIEVNQFEEGFKVVTESELDTAVDPDSGKFVLARNQSLVIGRTKPRLNVSTSRFCVESKEFTRGEKVPEMDVFWQYTCGG